MITAIGLRRASIFRFTAIGVLMSLGWVSPPLCQAAEVPDRIAKELQQLRSRVEEQERRLERLYRALGPHLPMLEEQAERLRQREEADRTLALERLADVSDAGFSELGCVNPVAAEFAVIQQDGSLRIFDGQGAAGRQLRVPGQHFTAAAFSPNGADLLTSTEAACLFRERQAIDLRGR